MTLLRPDSPAGSRKEKTTVFPDCGGSNIGGQVTSHPVTGRKDVLRNEIYEEIKEIQHFFRREHKEVLEYTMERSVSRRFKDDCYRKTGIVLRCLEPGGGGWMPVLKGIFPGF